MSMSDRIKKIQQRSGHARDERSFQHQSLQDKASIVRYLEAVAQGIQNGTLKFSGEGHDLVLEPHGLLKFEVRADKKRERVTLTLRCQWKQGESGKESPGSLTIDGQGDSNHRS